MGREPRECLLGGLEPDSLTRSATVRLVMSCGVRASSRSAYLPHRAPDNSVGGATTTTTMKTTRIRMTMTTTMKTTMMPNGDEDDG